MSDLILGTNLVSLDEPCWSVKEIVDQSPGSRGFHRYQAIRVVRNDRVAEFRRDLGPASRFQADEFVIPGGVADETTGRIEILHTVGELVDIADYLRSDRYEGPEKPEPTNLIQGYHDAADKRKLRRKRRSLFGSNVTIQRS